MRPRDPEELVFALCHEVGNLLAATRLHAHLLDAKSDPSKTASTAARIERASAHAGSLLAQIRPLLAPKRGTSLSVAPRDVLEGLVRALGESDAPRAEIDARSAQGLPDAAIDPELIHQLLLTALFGAVEAVGSEGSVRVRAEAAGPSVAFAVEDDAELEEPVAAGALRGRALACAAAEAILRASGGRLELARTEAGTRVAFLVPARRR